MSASLSFTISMFDLIRSGVTDLARTELPRATEFVRICFSTIEDKGTGNIRQKPTVVAQENGCWRGIMLVGNFQNLGLLSNAN
jgi:hypothetical protein